MSSTMFRTLNLSIAFGFKMTTVDKKDVNKENQLHLLFNLAIKCTKGRGEDTPNMINVAKILYRIERSFGYC